MVRLTPATIKKYIECTIQCLELKHFIFKIKSVSKQVKPFILTHPDLL